MPTVYMKNIQVSIGSLIFILASLIIIQLLLIFIQVFCILSMSN
nr:MAG TPA: hypothetical protein [Caudoviricetes sp.]